MVCGVCVCQGVNDEFLITLFYKVSLTDKRSEHFVVWYCRYTSLIGGSFTEECAEGPKWAGIEMG